MICGKQQFAHSHSIELLLLLCFAQVVGSAVRWPPVVSGIRGYLLWISSGWICYGLKFCISFFLFFFFIFHLLARICFITIAFHRSLHTDIRFVSVDKLFFVIFLFSYFFSRILSFAIGMTAVAFWPRTTKAKKLLLYLPWPVPAVVLLLLHDMQKNVYYFSI